MSTFRSPETKAAAIADYKAGMTMAQVGAKHGVSDSCVWRWLSLTDTPRRPASKARKVSGTCTIDGCEQPHKARGYCPLHYGHHIRGRKPRTDWTPFAPADRIEDCRWMAECGESLTGAAERLGLSRQGLLTWLAQNDRDTTDLLLSQDVLMPESRAGLRVSA